ncbi:MAG: AAA family ATPase [Promethearchaeota archaeon]
MIFPTSPLNEHLKKFPFSKGLISVWGDFGVGKTTFAIQTLFNSINKGNKVIYIYSKPIFPFEKIKRIIGNSVDDLNRITWINPENFEDLYKIIFNIEYLILKNFNELTNQYKLIVIDSLTDLYRLELNREKKDENYNLNYNLNQILANLFYINDSYHIDVLIINEKVQTRKNNQIIEVQSGGKVMEYWIQLDIKIEHTEILKKRKITLTNHLEDFQIDFISDLSENGFH